MSWLKDFLGLVVFLAMLSAVWAVSPMVNVEKQRVVVVALQP